MMKTNIRKLDGALGGGLPESSVTLISGPTGVGKTTLATQILVNGVKLGERGLFIAMEPTKNDILLSLSGYQWNVEEYLELGTITLLDYPSHEIGQFVAPTDPIKEIIHKYDIGRVVIDSVLPLAISTSKDGERLKLFSTIVERMRNWGTSTFLISDSPNFIPHEMPSTKWGIEAFTDNWIHLDFLFEDTTASRYLRVMKVRGKSHSLDVYPFTIGKNGLTL